MILKKRAIFLLPILCALSYCSKSDDSPKTILSVQVLQDSIPVEGASVTISFTTGETKTGFTDRLTDKNGIVNFTGVESKFYKVYAYKNCSYQLFNDGIDMSTVQIGTTKSFTTSIFPYGAIKVKNNTPYTYQVRGYNVHPGFSKNVSSGATLVFPFVQSFKLPEIDIQQYTGPSPHPVKSYDLPVICGDTSIITLN